jgi:hypothetical protein
MVNYDFSQPVPLWSYIPKESKVEDKVFEVSVVVSNLSRTDAEMLQIMFLDLVVSKGFSAEVVTSVEFLNNGGTCCE